jgi:sugar O-acyltransferase (sialic acid O-acetyltransferase NeuD family)
MKKAIIGAGGLAREIAAQIREETVYFVDDKYLISPRENVKPLSQFDPTHYEVCVAIADPAVRNAIVTRMPEKTKYFSYIHPSAIFLTNTSDVGEGSFIGCLSIVMNDVKIGRHTILNRANQIGHDTVVGDFFTALPGSVVSGGANVGKRVFLGASGLVLENLEICDDVVIGANACVTKNIQESAVYVGTPARRLQNLK